MIGLPPLPLLRTFEAAARRESFRRAAEELHVTPSAVSQQMRQLEAILGVALFARRARGLDLTQAGRDYLAEVGPALARLAGATRRLARPAGDGLLRVGAPRSFAVHWLLPRLPGFAERNPGIEIALAADDRLVDLGSEGIDLAVRFGPGRYPDLRAELLMGDAVCPACSPALLSGRPPPRRVADLRDFPLLHDEGLRPDEGGMKWAGWLDADPPGLRLSDAGMVLDAALLGLGAALVRRSLADGHLSAGRLVRLLPQERPTDYSYWVVTPRTMAEDRKAEAFREWIRAEVR